MLHVLQRFAEVLIICEGSHQPSAVSFLFLLMADGLQKGSIPLQAALCPRHPLHRTQSRRRAFGATIRRHRFLGVAGCCINRLSKRISLLVVAHRCCVLRPEWCQQWCQSHPPLHASP